MKRINTIPVFSFLALLLWIFNSGAIDLSNFNSKKLQNLQNFQEFEETPTTDMSQNFYPFNSSIYQKSIETVDNSLDPESYYIGGGDEFFISIVDNPSINFKGTINQQGDLYIAELGLERLGKISLSEAQKRISKFVQTKLKKSAAVNISLSKVKIATLSINGAVAKAGTYKIPGTYRVLDVLRAANNNEIPSLNICNFREVRCTNKDSTKIIDLFVYLLKNKISGNPYVYPGDIITLEYATKKVMLICQSKEIVSGTVPIKENEKLSDFLSLFTFDKSVDTTFILFQTTLASGDRITQTVYWNNADSVFLRDRDIITLPQKKNYNPLDLISISGEVARPGTYPIVKDSTSFSDLLAMAGGPTQFANIDRAVIARRSKIYDIINLNSQSTSSQTGQISAIAPVRPEIYAGFSKMNSMQDYSIIQIKKYGLSVKLRPNDEIIIPRKDVFVYVSGNVKRPGACRFVAGKSCSYYIHQCGGLTGKADKSNIFGLRYYGNTSQMTDVSDISEGDIIVIPDSQQAKFLSTVLLPIISTFASVVGVILAIYTISHAVR